MEFFTGFNLRFWTELGFRFRESTPYEGRQLFSATSLFDQYEFGLQISNTMSIASVNNFSTRDHEHHVVSEKESVEWFKSKSTAFSKKLEETYISK